MTRNIRKIVSIICAVAILLSISVVSFTGSSSAMVDVQGDLSKPQMTEEVNLTFQGEKPYGIPLGRYASGSDVVYENDYAKVKYSTNWIFFGKDGSVGETTIAHNNKDASKVNAALANLYKITSGSTYAISFKYKVLAGATVSSRAVDVGIAVGDPTQGGANRNSMSGLKTTGLTVEWKVNGIAQNTNTLLTADTDWQTATVEFTSTADGNFGIKCLGAGEGQYFAIDDFVVNKITGSYGVVKVAHDMEEDTAPGTILVNGNNGISIVDSGDEHGKVLEIASNSSATGYRFSAADGTIFEKGKKYYVSFDAKSISGTGAFGWIVLGDSSGSNVGGGTRAGIHDRAAVNSVLKWYVNGVETKFSNFKVTEGEWNKYGIVIDLTDDAVVAAFEGINANIFKAARSLSIGRPNTQFDNLEITGLDPEATPGYAFVEEVVDDEVKYTAIAAGSKYTLTTPVDTSGDRGFKCWVDADGKEIEDPTNYIPSKGYNKVTAIWTATFVKVTFIDGSTTSEPTRLGVGTKLLPPEKRPDVNLFFQGWVDADGKVYTEVPDKSITLYSKYNGTILTFDKIFAAEDQNGAGDDASLVQDPDDAKNSVLKLKSPTTGAALITLPAGDYQGADRFKLKTNTAYTYSIKYKVGAGSKGGEFQIVRGNGIYKSSSLERTNIPGVPAVKVSASDTATEWKTVTGTFTIGDSHYLERVYWFYQNNIILKSTGDFEIYFDDIVIAEVVDEAPEGAHAIHFKTNGPEIATIYGYPGEAVKVPTDITDGLSKFVGWYTDKKLTVPYTATEFGNEDITLYAKWEISPFVMDLEDYDNSAPASRCHLEVDSKGNHYLNWNSDFNPSQSAATMYSQQVNGNGLYCTLIPGAEYTVTFDYKLLRGSFDIGVIYNNAGGAWSDRKGGVKYLKLSGADEENWKTASFTFIAECDNVTNYLNFGVAGGGNCYFDNIVVECSTSTINLYGSTIITFNANGGKPVDPISGDPGELIGKLPTPTRANHQFDGWYTDAECKTKFTDKSFGEEGYTLYAKWVLGIFKESYEDFPKTITLAGGYKFYNKDSIGTAFDKTNVQNGGTSIFRNGATTGDKAFTLCRNDTLILAEGKQYTLTFYVKPTKVGQAAGTINLLSMDKYASGVNTPSKKEVITTVGELKVGEWQKVSYTFTATNKYVGISTSTGNDMYLDNFTVTVKGYTGTYTGDNSANPMLIIMMVILAAGVLTVTGKKVFEK